MNPAPLDDSDLDHLEQLLEADVFQGDAMRLDEIQAMLCAAVSGPVPVAPAVWLPEALGKGLENASDPQVLEALDLLMRLNNDIASALLNDETIAPILYPLDETCVAYDYEAWADTYVFGAGLAGDWFELAGKHAEDLSELLEPMFMLNGMLKEDAKKRANAGSRRPRKNAWWPISRRTCRSSCRPSTTSGATSGPEVR